MITNFVQTGWMILLFVMIRLVVKNKMLAVFYKYIWIFCAIKLWIPIPISMPKPFLQGSSVYSLHGVNEVPAQVMMKNQSSFSINYIWIAVAIGIACYFIHHYLCIKKIVDCSIPLQKNEIFESDQIQTPFTFGICKHRIILPKEIQQDIIPYVVLHEKAHQASNDNLWKYLMLATCCVFWFHPMVWVLRYFLNLDCEIVCDRNVVRHLSLEQRSGYAQALVTCLSTKNNILSSFCSQFSSSHYKERIINIMKFKKVKMTSVFLSSFLICGIITVCANDNGTSVTPPTDETPIQEEAKATSNNTNEVDYTRSYEEVFPIDYRKEVDAYVEAKHQENPELAIELPQEMLDRINSERRAKYGNEIDRYIEAEKASGQNEIIEVF